MEVKRSLAIDAGDKYYDTKKMCRNGHFSKRLTVDGSCIECRSIYQKKQRAEIRNKVAA